MGILHPVYHRDIEKKKFSHQDRVFVEKTLILFGVVGNIKYGDFQYDTKCYSKGSFGFFDFLREDNFKMI